MKWKNIKLSRKFTFGFGIVLIILSIVAIWSLVGINNIIQNAEQVNNALQQLNQVTQQNAAASEELATSAEELASQAEQLTEIISFFKVKGDTNNITSVNHIQSSKKKIILSENHNNDHVEDNVELVRSQDKGDIDFKHY